MDSLADRANRRTGRPPPLWQGSEDWSRASGRRPSTPNGAGGTPRPR